MKFRRVLGRIIYYGFAQFLPQSYLIVNQPFRILRNWSVKMMLETTGDHIGVGGEQ